jgi:pimeloyl-ACP methyl ester carboxylesterase
MVSPERVTDELVELRRCFYADPHDQKSLLNAYKSAFWLAKYPKYKISESDLKKIKNPTLVLWGSHNRGAGPQFGRQIANTIPNAKFACISDVAHWPQWEHPDRHDAIVLKFLKGR